MKEIKCFQEIETLRENKVFSEEVLSKLEEDLHVIHEWADMDGECIFQEFHADYFGNGYIAIFEGDEGRSEFEAIGIAEGIESIIPERLEKYLLAGQEWVRLVVIYNDSFSMTLWLPGKMKK